MQCTECPVKGNDELSKEFKTTEWWDMRKHYRKYHPEIKDPSSLFTKEARTEKVYDSEALKQLHGSFVDIKDNGGKVVGRGVLSYNPENNSISVSGCKIKGRAL